MTRNEALAIARAHFKALNSANMDFWRRRGQEPVEADFSYRIHILGHTFRSDELSNGIEV